MKRSTTIPLVIAVTALGAAIVTTAVSQPAGNDPTAVMTRETQQAMTPQQAVDRLKEGNKRFVENKLINRDIREQVAATAAGQYPYAVILSCQDSRTSSDIIFDMNKGDAFHIRIAGNIVNEDILGGLEFSTKVTGAKVIAVVGHNRCGAIRGAVDKAELGNLTTLLNKVAPAVDDVDKSIQPRTGANEAFVDKVAEANVRRVMRLIKEKSVILHDQLAKGEITLVGGMYDVNTGAVTFFEN